MQKEKKKKDNIFLSRRVLRDKDITLFVIAFASVTGILHFHYVRGATYEPSLFTWIVFAVFALFWIGMSFFAGRFKRKNYLVLAGVIWGMGLLCCIAALDSVQRMLFPPDSGQIYGTMAAYLAVLLLAFYAATLSPIENLMYSVFGSRVMLTTLDMLLLAIAVIVLLGACYLMGYLSLHRKPRNPNRFTPEKLVMPLSIDMEPPEDEDEPGDEDE